MARPASTQEYSAGLEVVRALQPARWAAFLERVVVPRVYTWIGATTLLEASPPVEILPLWHGRQRLVRGVWHFLQLDLDLGARFDTRVTTHGPMPHSARAGILEFASGPLAIPEARRRQTIATVAEAVASSATRLEATVECTPMGEEAPRPLVSTFINKTEQDEHSLPVAVDPAKADVVMGWINDRRTAAPLAVDALAVIDTYLDRNFNDGDTAERFAAFGAVNALLMGSLPVQYLSPETP